MEDEEFHRLMSVCYASYSDSFSDELLEMRNGTSIDLFMLWRFYEAVEKEAQKKVFRVLVNC